jgi:hypothetical protein
LQEKTQLEEMPGLGAITKVFDLFVGKTGLSSEEALRNGFDPIGHNRRYN